MKLEMNSLMRMVSCGFLCVLGYAAASEGPKELPSGIFLEEALVFSKVDVELRLDLFSPPRAAKPVPCVIVIQGGGFKAQDGKRFRPYAEYLAKHGLAAALIAYRGLPNHTYRESIADVKAAVRYVRKNAKDHNIDPDRIGAMGRSAGGTLAALLAVTSGMRALGDEGHPEHSSRIQAAVALAGVFDFVARFTDRRQTSLQPRLEAKFESNGKWIGAPFSSTNERWRIVSAINHLDESDPPMLLIHCRDDSTVPWIQTQDMHEKMIAAGVHSEIEYYETGGHGFRTQDPDISMARMVTFFKKVLGETEGTGGKSLASTRESQRDR